MAMLIKSLIGVSGRSPERASFLWHRETRKRALNELSDAYPSANGSPISNYFFLRLKKLSGVFLEYVLGGLFDMATQKNKEEEKIKKIQDQIAKKKAELSRIQARTKERARKIRTRRLIELGGLCDIAGISDYDKGALLGGFMHLARKMEDELTYSKFKLEGASILHKRASGERKK